MTSRLFDLAWPSAGLGEGMAALARRSGLPLRTEDAPAAEGAGSPAWIDSAARWLGVDAVSLEIPHPELGSFLRSPGPSIVGLTCETGEMRFLLLAGSRFGWLQVLGEDGALHRVRRRELARELEAGVAATATIEVERLLGKTDLAGRRRDAVRRHMVRERLHDEALSNLWLLRAPPGALLPDVRSAGLPRLVVIFAATYIGDYLLFIASWWLLGRAALAGQIDAGWLVAWALLFVTILPIRATSTWYEGRVAVAAGGLLKRRLLLGAMRLWPDETRRDGVGRHLSRVNESQAVESLALSGGLASFAATLELVVSVGILALGAGGALHAFLLVLTMFVFGLVAARYYRRRRAWAAARLSLSHDLVERMVGHRTRLAQQGPDGWHEAEDGVLASYLERSKDVDGPNAYVLRFDRIWLPVGLLGMAPAFLAGGVGPASVAVGLGALLLSSRGFRKLGGGFADLIDAVIAWKQIARLSEAASRRPRHGDPSLVTLSANGGTRALRANDVSFAYPRRPEPVLRGVDFELSSSDHVLLTSPSGGGKSTLVSILNGLREPDAGMLLLDGVDRPSLGAAAWTRKVATAPQFHENHVFTETFAFNLLMGRRWPPTPEDWREAETLCHELGLSELLKKMPGGMNQMIGDTGWQLSHGERSRLYLARALLQGGDVVLLDESFGALDPDNLRQALLTARRRARGLVVIAHP